MELVIVQYPEVAVVRALFCEILEHIRDLAMAALPFGVSTIASDSLKTAFFILIMRLETPKNYHVAL
jgi:hypothetical protein